MNVEHIVKDRSDRKRAAATTWATISDYSKDLLYTPSYRQDSIYHNLCYSSCEALTGSRNS